MTATSIRTHLSLAAALSLFLAAAAHGLGVGTISVANEGGRKVLKVATQGAAEPRIEALGERLVVIIPGGQRAMKTLKVGSDPVKQIRFGKEGGDLRVVLDLSRSIEPVLGAVSAKGFTVDLGPGAAVAVPAPAASAASEAAADESLSPAQAGYTYSIVDISLGGDEQHSEIVISANGPASYKPAVRENGRIISLTFRNSSLSYTGDLARLNDAAVKSVSARQSSAGGESQVLIEVRLEKKLDYALQRDQNQLVLRLEKPVVETKSPERGDLEKKVSIEVQNADLVGVLKTLAVQAGFDYQFTKDILGRVPPESLVTLKVQDRPLREVLDTLLAQVDAKFLRQGNTLYMGSEGEIFARRNRLPTITRTYSPKYLSYKQLVEIISIQYFFDDKSRDRIKGIVQDPRDKQRIMLIGTQDEVSDWLSIISRFDVPESGEAAASADGGGGNKTQIFKLQYLEPSKHGSLITESIKQLYPEGETQPQVFLDPTTRNLVVTTQLKYLRKIEKLLTRLDIRPEQVNIEGKIIEVNQAVSRQLGINWSTFQTQGNTTTDAQFAPLIGVDFISQLSYSTISNGTRINATIDALVNESKADLVSSPNITVNDNETAFIVSSDSLVTLRTIRETTTTGTIVTTEATTFDVPLTLEVKPQISKADRRVAMKILFSLKTATGPSAAAGAPPPTSQQTANTNISVDSGQTAVIGGMVRQNNLMAERKVPILGDIPLLGMLFRFETESKDKKEVIIFITPSIVED